MGYAETNKDLHGYEIHGLLESKTNTQKIDSYYNHLQWLRGKEIEARHDIERKILKLNEANNKINCIECNNKLTENEIKDKSNNGICEDCLCPA